MKRFILTALGVVFLCLKISGQAITNPQVPVTGNVGCVGFPCLNNGTLNFTADANQTMTALQTSANGGVKITSTVSLTATRTLIVPSGNFQFMDIENATMGGQAVSVCSTTGGSCVTIPNGATIAGVWFDGTNFVAPSAGGGGSMTYPAANTLGLSNGSANAWTTPTYANIVSLWSSCTSGYLQYNGTCNTPSGGGTVTAVGVTTANGVSGTSSGGSTPSLTISLGAITPSSVASTGAVSGTTGTFSAGITSSGSSHGLTIPAGTPVSGAAGSVVYTSDATNGYAEVSENNGALARVCTFANSICAGGTPAFSSLTSGTNTAAAMVVGSGASLAASGSGSITATAVPSSGITGNLGTINSVTFPAGGSITLPLFCAGFGCSNYNQNNPNFPATAITATTASITASTTTIPVTSTSGWPSVGCGYLGTGVEYFCWDSITPTSLILTSASERGLNGYTAASHPSGAAVVGASYTFASCPTCVQQIQVSTIQVGYNNGINPALTGLAWFGGSVVATGTVAAPAFSINGATNITSTSSANSQVVTCPTGGTGTQVCDAAGNWINAGVTTIATCSGSQTVTLTAGLPVYDITLSANCIFTIATSSLASTIPQRVTLIIRPAGFTATLPASSGSLVWSTGVTPNPSTSAITVISFLFSGTNPVVGGI